MSGEYMTADKIPRTIPNANAITMGAIFILYTAPQPSHLSPPLEEFLGRTSKYDISLALHSLQFIAIAILMFPTGVLV